MAISAALLSSVYIWSGLDFVHICCSANILILPIIYQTHSWYLLIAEKSFQADYEPYSVCVCMCVCVLCNLKRSGVNSKSRKWKPARTRFKVCWGFKVGDLLYNGPTYKTNLVITQESTRPLFRASPHLNFTRLSKGRRHTCARAHTQSIAFYSLCNFTG